MARRISRHLLPSPAISRYLPLFPAISRRISRQMAWLAQLAALPPPRALAAFEAVPAFVLD